MKQNRPLCPINIKRRKIFWKKLKQNKGTVSLQHNRGTSKNNTKILRQTEDPCRYYIVEGLFKKVFLQILDFWGFRVLILK